MPSKYAPTNHSTQAKAVEDAISALEYVEWREATGSYVLFNDVDPNQAL